eukprot:6750069-Prymnesium_polylepis.1
MRLFGALPAAAVMGARGVPADDNVQKPVGARFGFITHAASGDACERGARPHCPTALRGAYPQDPLSLRHAAATTSTHTHRA